MELFSLQIFASVVITTYLLYVSLYIVFSFFELLFPAEVGHTITGRLRNLGITAVYLLLGIAAWMTLQQFIDFPEPQYTNLDFLPSVLIILLFIFISDFLYYWYHRAQHSWSFLWPIHEVHHADTELNVTTSYRTYWLEVPLQSLIVSLPASFVLGDIGSTYVITFFIFIIWEFFTHINVRLHLSFLSPIICGPQVHRIHHSILEEHHNKNFAQYFPIIDVIFGTYYNPGPDEFPPTGSKGLASDASLPTVLAHPVKMWLKSIFDSKHGS